MVEEDEDEIPEEVHERAKKLAKGLLKEGRYKPLPRYRRSEPKRDRRKETK